MQFIPHPVTTVTAGIATVIATLQIKDALGLPVAKMPDSYVEMALESALHRLEAAKKLVIIAGPLPSPRSVFDRAHLEDHHDNVFVATSVDDAIQLGKDLILLTPDEAPRTSERSVARGPE